MPHVKPSFANILGGIAPALRYATLERLELYHGLEALSNLRSLDLRRVRGLSVQDFLQLVSQSPELENISVTSTDFAPPQANSPRFYYALTRLCKLKLSYITSASTTAILNPLPIPATTTISIRTVWTMEGHFASDPSFSNLVDTVVRKCQTDDVRAAYRIGHSFVIRSYRWKISTDVVQVDWAEQVDSSLQSTYFLHALPNSVRGNFEYVGQEVMNPILRALDVSFPSLHTLTFELQRYPENFDLNALTDTNSTAPVKRRWLCLGLRTLTVFQTGLDLPCLQAVAHVINERVKVK